jgi:hypothetical protein
MMESESSGTRVSQTVSRRSVVRGGEPVRVYRRPEERRMLLAGIALITVSVGLPLATSVLKGPVPIAGLFFLGLFLCIPAALFWSCQRLGVYVSRSGVKNVGMSRTSFTSWSNIVRFVVDVYTPLSACVQAEHPDGSRTPLTALSRWVRWKDVLFPYCDALNGELAAAGVEQRATATRATEPRPSD